MQLADLEELVKVAGGSRLKRDRLIHKIRKWGESVGGLEKIPQAEFVKLITQGSEIDPEKTSFQLCAARLRRGDWSDWSGWQYRDDWAKSTYRELPTKRWRLEKIKTLAVLGEQGIGDEILFASCLPDVLKLGIEVTVECDPRLLGVFSRMGVKSVPRKKLNAVRDEDAFIPLGDLPRLFRKSLKDFPGLPFLSPLKEMVEKWGHLKGRTGIAWRGRKGHFDPKDLGIPGGVCVQYDPWEYETEGLEVPNIDLRNDIEDVLGICANLSRIVTVPQTIVHLAGSIGTRVDVVCPPVEQARVIDQLNWRYGQKKMPWYKSVTVYPTLKDYRCAWS